MSDKLEELVNDLASVRKSFNQIFSTISKCLCRLDEAETKAKELKRILKEAGVER